MAPKKKNAGVRDGNMPDRVMAWEESGESRFRSLLEHLPVGVYRTTPQGRIIECNPALAAILGFADRSQLRAVNVNTFYIRRSVRRTHLRNLLYKPELFGEYELLTRDGRSIWVHDYSKVVLGPEGRIRYYDGILIDVSVLKVAEAALQQSEEDYRRLFENAHDAIIIFAQAHETILAVNDRACTLYGFSREEFKGLSWSMLSRDAEESRKHVEQVVTEPGCLSFETIHCRKDGREMVLEVNASPVHYQGQLAILSSNRDITERRRMEETIRQMAYYDSLTGLPNRILFCDRLSVALHHCQRYGQRLPLLFLDLDGFKNVNDSAGHEAGDRVLQTVSRRLRKLLRQEDTIARLGGDEFLILLADISEESDVLHVVGKILKKIHQPLRAGHWTFHLSGSIGIAFAPDHGLDAAELIRHADKAMYLAKSAGHDTYRVYTADGQEDRENRFARHEPPPGFTD